MNNNYYCIIMAGGIGRRFWPYSRKALPKQFLDFFGTGVTLLQQTYDRYKQIISPDNIYITTHKDYKNIVLELLPHFNEEQLIIEEERRNTAPSIAYASYFLKKKNPNATIVVAPSDHLILKTEQLYSARPITLRKVARMMLHGSGTGTRHLPESSRVMTDSNIVCLLLTRCC